MVKTAPSALGEKSLSYNLQGQRLGRKGRDTRDRILAAAEKLLVEGPPGAPVTLSAVAREASLAMTTLYLYFSDLTELLIAVMEPIMATAEQSYVGQLRQYWPDAELHERCQQFVESFLAFWVKNSRVLHLRNSIADSHDARMVRYRVGASRGLIELFVAQMEGEPVMLSPAYFMGTVLLTGIERMITVATDVTFQTLVAENPVPHIDGLMAAEARLLELAIIDGRAQARRNAQAESPKS